MAVEADGNALPSGQKRGGPLAAAAEGGREMVAERQLDLNVYANLANLV